MIGSLVEDLNGWAKTQPENSSFPTSYGLADTTSTPSTNMPYPHRGYGIPTLDHPGLEPNKMGFVQSLDDAAHEVGIGVGWFGHQIDQMPIAGRIMHIDRAAWNGVISPFLGFGSIAITQTVKDFAHHSVPQPHDVGDWWHQGHEASPFQIGMFESPVNQLSPQSMQVPDPTTTEGQAQYHQGFLKVISGAGDAYLNWKLDPLVLAGKAAKVARVANTYDVTTAKGLAKVQNHLGYDLTRVNAGLDPTTAIGKQAYGALGKDEATILETNIARGASNPETAAHAMALAQTPQEMHDLILSMSGDLGATKRLMASAPSMLDSAGRITGISQYNPQLMSVLKEDLGINAQIVADYAKRNEAFQQMLDTKLTEVGSSLKSVAKVSDFLAEQRLASKLEDTTFWRDTVFQGAPLMRPIRMIYWLGNSKPAGIIGMTGQSFVDSAREMTAWVNTVRSWTPEQRLRAVNQWAGTTNALERATLLEQIKQDALRSEARHYGSALHSEEDIHRAADWFQAQHNVAVKKARDDFLGPGEGKIADATPDEITVVHGDITDHIKDSSPMPDMQLFRKSIKEANAAGDFYNSMVGSLDKLSAIWRPAVLWHAGNTFKQSMMEPMLRALAYANGSWWTDPLFLGRPAESVTGRFFINMSRRLGDSNVNLIRTSEKVAIASKLQEHTARSWWLEDELHGLYQDRALHEASTPSYKVKKGVQSKSARAQKYTNDATKFHETYSGLLDQEIAAHEEAQLQLNKEIENLRSLLAKKTTKRPMLGTGQTTNVTRSGVEYPAAFGGILGETHRNLQSAEGTLENTLVGPKVALLRSVRLSRGYRMIKPNAKNYFDELAARLDGTLRSQKIIRLMAAHGGNETASIDEGMKFLATKEGKDWRLSRNFDPGTSDRAVASYVYGRLVDYGHGDASILGALATDSPIDKSLVRAKLAGRSDLNDISGHPLEFDPAWNANSYAWARRARDRIFGFVNAKPDNVLSRFPLGNSIYRKGMETDIQRYLERYGYAPSDVDLEKMARANRAIAMREVNRTIYTVQRYSNIAQSLRLVAPFTQATVNQILVWGRLFRRNPAALAHYFQVLYHGTDVLGLRDQNGNITHDPNALDSHFTMQVPQSLVKKWSFLKPLQYMNGLQLSPHALDPINQGTPWWNPGSGPMVTMIASELAKQQPHIDQIMQQHFGVHAPNITKFFKDTGILPYGPSQLPLSVDAWMPSDLQNAYAEFKKGDNPRYMSSVQQLYMTEYLDWQMGGRQGPQPSMKDVLDHANAFLGIRFLESLMSPVSVTNTSKYSAMIDDYHNMLQKNHNTAHADFIKKYGSNAFAAMASSTKNDWGLNATRGTIENLMNYKDITSKYGQIDKKFTGFLMNTPGQFDPNLIGWEDANGGIYGSTDTFRSQQSPEQNIKDQQTANIWQEYIKFTNRLQLLNGPGNLSPLYEAMKKSWVSSEAANPDGSPTDWYLQYNQTDGLSTAKRAYILQGFLSDPKWMAAHQHDPMWSAAADYLTERASFASMLQDRANAGGSADIKAQSNADLYATWRALAQQIASTNTKWNDLYLRYFENDPLNSATGQ